MPEGLSRRSRKQRPLRRFIAGAKAIVPLLLALIPFGVAFGAFRSTFAI
jgi:predicted branched-subunit amino acid permease